MKWPAFAGSRGRSLVVAFEGPDKWPGFRIACYGGHVPRGRHAISLAEYQRIVEGYRRHPDSERAVAEFSGLARGTVRKAWLVGFPRDGHRPVKDVLAEEEAIVRALRQATEDRAVAAALLDGARRERSAMLDGVEAEVQARLAKVEQEAEAKMEASERVHAARLAELTERAKFDALDQRADEATMSKAARKNVITMHGLIASSLSGARALAARISTLMTDGEGKDPLTIRQATELFRQLTRGVKDVSQASLLALQVERLRVGDPMAVLAVTGSLGPVPTMQEAEMAFSEAAAMIDIARKRLDRPPAPMHVVEPGGQANGTNGKVN